MSEASSSADSGNSGNNETMPSTGGTCNENMCGPKEGEILKGDDELTMSDEQWRKKLTPEQFKATVDRLPTREEMDQTINEQLIVEFYSRF